MESKKNISMESGSNANQQPKIESYLIKDNSQFPNNDFLPVLIYRKVITLPEQGEAADSIKKIFEQNDWGNSWENGIYIFHHYHSNTHEVLGIRSGSVTVQLGGIDGVITSLSRGDIIIIPAGVAHRNVNETDGFSCVGAYPDGRDFDMNYGKSEERPQADENISKVPQPQTDPVFGEKGFLTDYWNTKFSKEKTNI
jgi:uncharacterized protein YjlB